MKLAQKITWQIIDTDNVINWVLGISLILVPDFFNKIFFGHEVLSHWIYIVTGIGLLWFAVWQVDSLIKSRQLTVQALRFSALLAWLSVVVMAWVLIVLSSRILLMSKVVLWLMDVLMLLLGGWYWWVSKQIEA